MNHLTLSGKNLTDLMQAVLEKNADFRFQARGHSMSPFIKHLDIVTISPLPGNGPDTGDIVAAISHERKSIMIHRVIQKQRDKLVIKGDNNKAIDGFFDKNQIIGRVSRVERNGKIIRYGGGKSGLIIAFFSKTGFLNAILFPFLRSVKAMVKNLFF